MSKSLMMKNYLKTRFIWQFIRIVSGVVLLYAWFGGSAMIRFLVLAGYFELTMYLQLSGKLNQYINLHYSLLGLYFHVLVLCFSSCAADHLVKQIEIHRSSLWLLGQSGEYFLALYSLFVGLFFPTVTFDSPNSLCQRGYHFPVVAGSSREIRQDGRDNNQYLKPDAM